MWRQRANTWPYIYISCDRTSQNSAARAHRTHHRLATPRSARRSRSADLRLFHRTFLIARATTIARGQNAHTSLPKPILRQHTGARMCVVSAKLSRKKKLEASANALARSVYTYIVLSAFVALALCGALDVLVSFLDYVRYCIWEFGAQALCAACHC